MTDYLFRFGFCTPAQWKANEEHGWDDECSEMFFVRARDAQEAMSWGREVADMYCRHLFKLKHWDGPIPSWKDSGFAHWIEEDLSTIPKEFINRTPHVNAGVMPTFSNDDYGPIF